MLRMLFLNIDGISYLLSHKLLPWLIIRICFSMPDLFLISQPVILPVVNR